MGIGKVALALEAGGLAAVALYVAFKLQEPSPMTTVSPPPLPPPPVVVPSTTGGPVPLPPTTFPTGGPPSGLIVAGPFNTRQDAVAYGDTHALHVGPIGNFNYAIEQGTDGKFYWLRTHEIGGSR